MRFRRGEEDEYGGDDGPFRHPSPFFVDYTYIMTIVSKSLDIEEM